MLSLVFGLIVLSFHFIVIIGDDITQNRLIHTYQNESYYQSANITSNTQRRLAGHAYGVVPVQNFQGDNARYLGVALITTLLGTPHCTGSYIKTPPGAVGKYVLTAAHCLFNKKGKKKKGKHIYGYFYPVWSLRIEFGVTNGHKKTSCKISDYRVNDEYPGDVATAMDKKGVRYDYGIIKLAANCEPPTSALIPYQMAKYVSATHKMRAGYAGTRILGIAKMHSVTKQIKQEVVTGKINPFHPGAAKGDSGGPIFDKETHHIMGVTSAVTSRYMMPVKFKQKQLQNINNYIFKKDGISPRFKKCGQSQPSQQCWSVCRSTEPSQCYNSQNRQFAQPRRKIPCNTDPIWTECGKMCPNNRRKVNHKVCTKQNGVSSYKSKCIKTRYIYLCDKVNEAHTAHFGLKNFMKMYYDDMDDENESDDFYYDDYDDDESAAYYDDDDADYYDDDSVGN